MATAPVKPPLHNFGISLQWGSKNHTTTSNHRHRRPVSAEPEPSADDHHNNDSSPPPPSHNRVGSRTSRGGGHLFSLTSCSAEKLPKPPPPPPQNSEKEGGDDDSDNDNNNEEAKEAAEEAAEEAEVQKRWKLRPRRAAAMTSKAEVVHEAEKQSEQAAPAPKSMRLRGLAAEGPSVEKKEKRKFWIALSKDEIEEDIYSMTGSRPARRPKKRPKNVQKQLDNCFPGLWLVGFSADAYKGAESPTKK